MKNERRLIPFEEINRASLARAEDIVRRWLPDGRREGHEWVARNPRRADRRVGSFKVNLVTGKWGDFATGDVGGDLVSLAAFLFVMTQGEAGREVARMVGVAIDD